MGKKVLQGETDLESVNPTLAEEWHRENNGVLSPRDVFPGSDIKAWWKCQKCGYEWQMRIANRTNGQGCPLCRKNNRSKIASQWHLEKSGSLLENNESLAKEWHREKNHKSPSEVTPNCNLVVWWIGTCGHEWQASVGNRNRGTGCPYCSNQKILKGFNDLKTVNPKIAEEWNNSKNDGVTPSDVLYTSRNRYWWKGTCGHEWIQTVYHRTVRNQGCPLCSKRMQSSFPEQALFFYVKKVFPDAINKFSDFNNNQMELDIYIPSTNIGIEYDGAAWHNTEQSYKREIRKYNFCKSKNITLIRVRENECEMQAVINEIADVSIQAKRHATNRELECVIKEVVDTLKKDTKIVIDINRDSASIAEQYYNSEISNSLATKSPRIAEEWYYEKNGNLKPNMISARSGKYVWWKCKKGHVWQARIASRTGGSNCPYCANKKVLVGYNDLETTNPTLASEWHPTRNEQIKPCDVIAGSPKKYWWQGSCGHEWQASLANRSKGSGCPYCKNRKKAY